MNLWPTYHYVRFCCPIYRAQVFVASTLWMARRGMDSRDQCIIMQRLNRRRLNRERQNQALAGLANQTSPPLAITYRRNTSSSPEVYVSLAQLTAQRTTRPNNNTQRPPGRPNNNIQRPQGRPENTAHSPSAREIRPNNNARRPRGPTTRANNNPRHPPAPTHVAFEMDVLESDVS
jgi:hypothetical protein